MEGIKGGSSKVVCDKTFTFRSFRRRGDDNDRVIKGLSHGTPKKTLFTFTRGLVCYQLMLLLIRAVLDQVGCGIFVAEQDLTSY